jgi:hypothetical protein
VGWAIAFSWTVVSTVTRSRLEGFVVPLSSAISTVAFNTRSISSGPIRWRQRVISDGSIGGACWKNSKPQKYCQYGFSTQRSTVSSSDRSKVCFR